MVPIMANGAARVPMGGSTKLKKDFRYFVK